MREIVAQITLSTTLTKALSAFIDPRALSDWWGVRRCFIEQFAGGQYILTWGNLDSITFSTVGRIVEYNPQECLHLDQMVYMNPAYPLLGPMQLDIDVRSVDQGTVLQVKQAGYKDGPDWDWYFAATQAAWPQALQAIRDYLNAPES